MHCYWRTRKFFTLQYKVVFFYFNPALKKSIIRLFARKCEVLLSRNFKHVIYLNNIIYFSIWTHVIVLTDFWKTFKRKRVASSGSNCQILSIWKHWTHTIQTKLNYQCFISGLPSSCFGLVNNSLGKTSTQAFVIFKSCQVISHFLLIPIFEQFLIFKLSRNKRKKDKMKKWICCCNCWSLNDLFFL